MFFLLKLLLSQKQRGKTVGRERGNKRKKRYNVGNSITAAKSRCRSNVVESNAIVCFFLPHGDKVKNLLPLLKIAVTTSDSATYS